MISTALRAGALALALSAGALGASPASAHPFFPPHVPGWHHGFGWGGFGWGGGFYPHRPIAYGGCIVRKFIDDEGDLVVRRTCF